MAAGKLDQTAKQQQPRRQLPRRQSNSLPEAVAVLDAPSAMTAVAKSTKPPRPTRRQQQQQQQDVPQPEAAEPQRASKRLKQSDSNSSDSNDTAQRDTAAGASSSAVSRRGSPAPAAVASTPAHQQGGIGLPVSAPYSGSAATTTPGSGGLSAFEAERAARIANNLARLAALELPELAADLAASVPVKHKAAPTQRGVGGKRKRSEPSVPLRQSARTRGQAPDPSTAGGIDYEARDGSVVLAAALEHLPLHVPAGSSAEEIAAAAAAAAALLTAPIPFKSTNGDEGSDAAFLALLKSQAAAAAAAAAESAVAMSAAAVTGHELSQLSLSAVDVAKMTRDGVSCLAFHPGTEKLIIAAADKHGKVGLWDIDQQQQQQQQQPDADSSSSPYDGILMFEPHRDYISSLKWCQGGSRLMTGSYDGTVRLLDVESGVFDVVSGFPAGVSDDGWSAGEAAAEGAVLFMATSDGHMTCLDTRAPDSSSTWVIANRKVNTLHLHSNQFHLASSASDGTVAVWDVRHLGTPAAAAAGSSSKPHAAKAVCKVQHQKSSQAAYWCPDRSCKLLSISFDDTLRIWEDPAGKGHMQQALSIRHNNNTGRWVVPFRPAWSPAGDAVVVGDLKRGVALFDSSSGKQLALLQAEALTAIPSRMALHPSRQVKVLAAATSSGRVHIWR